MTRAARIVSFWFGEPYYQKAAETLRKDCESLGLACCIEEAMLPATTGWIDACRHKVRFMVECVERFDEPLLWIDADCRILAPAAELLHCTSDLGFFLRGFRDVRKFDPVALPRFIQPSILAFGATDASRRFIRFLGEIERSYSGRATDDYFLQEAWDRFEGPLSVTIASPALVALDDEAGEGAAFRFGRSGHAAQYKGQADQHAVALFSQSRRKALFLKEAQEAGERGDAAEQDFFVRKAAEADPDDMALARRMAESLWHRGDAEGARRWMRRSTVPGGYADLPRRFLAEMAIKDRDFGAARSHLEHLEASPVDSDRAWAGAQRLFLELDERAARLCVPDRQRVSLSWMEGPHPGNFGDILNPYIVERLTGIPPRRVPFGEGLLAIGSTVKFARPGGLVWGAGIPRLSDRVEPRAVFRAVRGPLTRQAVLAAGGTCPEIYGDPAVLLPLMYSPKACKPRHKLGVVLHHAHRGLLACEADVKLIDVSRSGYAGIESFIDELHDCEAIVSTSLHGVIVSHAYGIPAAWAEVETAEAAIPGDGSKFRDYLLSVGLNDVSPVRLRSDQAVTSLTGEGARVLPSRAIGIDALVQAAPFRVRSDWRSRR